MIGSFGLIPKRDLNGISNFSSFSSIIIICLDFSTSGITGFSLSSGFTTLVSSSLGTFLFVSIGGGTGGGTGGSTPGVIVGGEVGGGVGCIIIGGLAGGLGRKCL